MSPTNSAYDDTNLQQVPHSIPQPAEEPRRSPEQQAEVERLGAADTYLELDSDKEWFNWLDDQRDRKSCSYVTATEGSELHKACLYYWTERVKQRGKKFLLPVSVIYAEVYQYGGPSDLYSAILEAGGHPLAHIGPLKDRRPRTWDMLKDYRTKILIVNNADYLTLESFNELIDLSKKLQISVVLVGIPYLEQILNRSSLPFIRVHNAFLECYQFPRLSSQEVTDIVDDWEELFLPEVRRLKLTSVPEIKNLLCNRSGGLRKPLYDILRDIAVLKVDDPSFELSLISLTNHLGRRKVPKIEGLKKKSSSD